MSERDMAALLALVERALGKEWIEIGEWLRNLDANSLAAIEERLIRGDFAGLVQQVEDAARTFAAATHATYEQAGRAAAVWLDEQPALHDRIIRFDAASDHAVIAARRNELELVQGLAGETRENVQRALVDGTRAGTNPRRIAVDIRDSITLTPTQAQHVANYRRALEQGDWSNALSRELRDARSDRTLRRLSRDGGSLTEEQVDKLTERYRKNYVAFRAETIARTEAGRNVHEGLAETYRQAIERGDIEADQLVKEWIHAGRGRQSREQHRAMDGRTVTWGEVFELPDGTRMRWPHDANAPVSHLANCRCTFATTLAA